MGEKSNIGRRALLKGGLAPAGLPAVSKLLGSTAEAAAAAKGAEASLAAIPGQKGGQDIFGAYDVAPNWPQPLSALPGNEQWTWGSCSGIFAENPDRVFIFQRGQLPNLKRPKEIDLPQLVATEACAQARRRALDHRRRRLIRSDMTAMPRALEHS